MKRLIDLLSEDLKTTVPMHMPGHKRNVDGADYLKRLSADLDITEIKGFDNLHEPTGIIADAMKRASSLYKAKRSYFLVNGSTVGLLSAVYATVKRGDKVLCARNCHSAVFNALEIVGAVPVYILPETDPDLGFSYVSSDAVEELYRNNDGIKLCIITSPTYEGIESDIEKIASTVHKYGSVLLVDAAHGAHFGFDPSFPENAVTKGADLVVHSLHKTLPSLTQTALLHLCSERVSASSVERALSVFETSSPSYLLMASIDGCLDLIEKNGKTLFDEWNRLLDTFYADISELNKLSVYLPPESVIKDKSKIVILCSETDLNGYELADRLRDKGIEPEMACPDYVLAMTGLTEKKENLDKLKNALFEIDGTLSKKEKSETLSFPLPPFVMTSEEAKNREKVYVPFSEVLNKISGVYIKAYPPGIPLIVPGERFDRSVCAYISEALRKGTEFLCSDGDLSTKISVIND